jgi:uridine kinase
LFDAFNDRSYPERWIDAEPDCIAIVDGAFLLRPELENCWDVLVWLDIDFETMVERARERDMAWVGSEDAVVERYRDTGSPRTDSTSGWPTRGRGRTCSSITGCRMRRFFVG